jgi:hypothetical protein
VEQSDGRLLGRAADDIPEDYVRRNEEILAGDLPPKNRSIDNESVKVAAGK